MEQGQGSTERIRVANGVFVSIFDSEFSLSFFLSFLESCYIRTLSPPFNPSFNLPTLPKVHHQDPIFFFSSVRNIDK